MEQESINENIIASVSRAMLHEEKAAYPLHYNEIWSSLSAEEKQALRAKATQWLTDLKNTSPKTYQFVENNYAEVPYR